MKNIFYEKEVISMGWGMLDCPECGQNDQINKNDDGETYNCTRCDEIFYENGTPYRK